MTFQEYLNQEEPKRGNLVVLTMDDLYNHWKIGRQIWVELIIEDECFTYSLSETGVCWTTDDHGNKKSPSCFILPNYQPNATNG